MRSLSSISAGKASLNSARRGAATVEFAITAPIVFLLFFAAFDFCRLSMITHTAEQAAYEGARRGAIPGATALQAQQEAESELARIGIQQASVAVSPSEILSSTERVTVTVRIPLAANGWVSPRVLNNSYITRSCTLTREYVTQD